MNDGQTDREINQRIAEEEDCLAAMSDKDINTDDIPEVLDWSNAVRSKFYQPAKESVRDDSSVDA